MQNNYNSSKACRFSVSKAVCSKKGSIRRWYQQLKDTGAVEHWNGVGRLSVYDEVVDQVRVSLEIPLNYLTMRVYYRVYRNQQLWKLFLRPETAPIQSAALPTNFQRLTSPCVNEKLTNSFLSKVIFSKKQHLNISAKSTFIIAICCDQKTSCFKRTPIW